MKQIKYLSFWIIVALWIMFSTGVFAQWSFDDLVSELLGGSSNSSSSLTDTLANKDVDTSCWYNNVSQARNSIVIKKFEDDELVVEMDVAKDGNDIMERYEMSVLPVMQDDIDNLLDDDNLVDILDIIEAKRIAPTIVGNKMTFALNVTDSNVTQYLSVYPLDGTTRCQGVEDFRIQRGDGPSSTTNFTESVADCLTDVCEYNIDQVSCKVNESTLRATLTWNNLWWADDLEIYMREHDENQFELEATESISDESYSLTLPQKTSYLFLLRPVDSDGNRVWTEITYLCKFTDSISTPSACVWEWCVTTTPTSGPESGILIILWITGVFFVARRFLKK